MDLLLGKFVKKYVDTFTYDELLDLYKFLEEDDDEIFKWYSGSENNNKIIENKVSQLLKNLNLDWRRGWDSNPRMSKPIASFQD